MVESMNTFTALVSPNKTRSCDVNVFSSVTDLASLGRTARIGNEGFATSLYNHDKNSDISQALVNILLETGQAVPDFLQELKPEGQPVFDDDTDEDSNNNETASGEEAQVSFGEAAPSNAAPPPPGNDFTW